MVCPSCSLAFMRWKFCSVSFEGLVCEVLQRSYRTIQKINRVMFIIVNFNSDYWVTMSDLDRNDSFLTWCLGKYNFSLLFSTSVSLYWVIVGNLYEMLTKLVLSRSIKVQFPVILTKQPWPWLMKNEYYFLAGHSARFGFILHGHGANQISIPCISIFIF